MEHKIFKALSEPIRLRIIALLAEGELCVCDLTEALELPQSTVSRHMAYLKAVGFVRDRRNGKWVYYKLKISTNPLFRSLTIFFQSLKQCNPYKKDLEKLFHQLKEKQC
ncbi:MAG: ArsR/SmtB family transcription factor [Candidatus Zixiibacteriota bacterium]